MTLYSMLLLSNFGLDIYYQCREGLSVKFVTYILSCLV
jgi:hypothetical protein